MRLDRFGRSGAAPAQNAKPGDRRSPGFQQDRGGSSDCGQYRRVAGAFRQTGGDHPGPEGGIVDAAARVFERLVHRQIFLHSRGNGALPIRVGGNVADISGQGTPDRRIEYGSLRDRLVRRRLSFSGGPGNRKHPVVRRFPVRNRRSRHLPRASHVRTGPRRRCRGNPPEAGGRARCPARLPPATSGCSRSRNSGRRCRRSG